MRCNDKNVNNHSDTVQRRCSWDSQTLTVEPVFIHKDNCVFALRTYVTWLVRATRRKMAASGPDNSPENTPKKEVELT